MSRIESPWVHHPVDGGKRCQAAENNGREQPDRATRVPGRPRAIRRGTAGPSRGAPRPPDQPSPRQQTPAKRLAQSTALVTIFRRNGRQVPWIGETAPPAPISPERRARLYPT